MKIIECEQTKCTKLVNEEDVIVYICFWDLDGRVQCYMNAQQRHKEISDAREYYSEYGDVDNE